mmetsp:Transcript_2988/g.9955  ORF Transcript_2988/g.9955 Transcript_2988/m.9955 type:complete len:498 (-) Transcript_2988:437-1930(-)
MPAHALTYNRSWLYSAVHTLEPCSARSEPHLVLRHALPLELRDGKREWAAGVRAPGARQRRWRGGSERRQEDGIVRPQERPAREQSAAGRRSEDDVGALGDREEVEGRVVRDRRDVRAPHQVAPEALVRTDARGPDRHEGAGLREDLHARVFAVGDVDQPARVDDDPVRHAELARLRSGGPPLAQILARAREDGDARVAVPVRHVHLAAAPLHGHVGGLVEGGGARRGTAVAQLEQHGAGLRVQLEDLVAAHVSRPQEARRVEREAVRNREEAAADRASEAGVLAAEAEDGREVERLRVHEVCPSTVEKVEPLPIGRSAGHLPERAALARLPVLCDSGVERRVGRGRGRRHLAVALDAQGRGGEVVLVAHLLAPLVEADPSRAVDAARVVEAVQLETLSLGERARLGQQADDLRLLRRQAADRRLRRAVRVKLVGPDVAREAVGVVAEAEDRAAPRDAASHALVDEDGRRDVDSRRHEHVEPQARLRRPALEAEPHA